MLAKIITRYFAIPPERKPSVFAKYAIKGIDDLRGRNEFICDELIRLTRDGKIVWRSNAKKNLFILSQEEYAVVLRKLPKDSSSPVRFEEMFILNVFGKDESSEQINICGEFKNETAFLPIVDLWDTVSGGGLRGVAVKHICWREDFDPDKDICHACEYPKNTGE